MIQNSLSETIIHSNYAGKQGTDGSPNDTVHYQFTTGDTAVCDSLVSFKTQGVSNSFINTINALVSTLDEAQRMPPRKAWIVRYKIYKLLKSNPGIVTERAEFSAFVSQMTNHNIGRIVEIEDLIKTSFDNTTVSNLQGNLLQAGNEVSNLSPNNLIESYYKEVFSIYLANLLSGQDSLTTSQLVTLSAIAPLCPHEFGPGIYKARALISRYDDVIYEDNCGMNGSSNQFSNKTVGDEINELKIYPNPAHNSFIIKFNFKEEGTNKFVLFDLLGKVMVERNISEQTGSIEISAKHISSGIYSYGVLKSGKLQINGKLAIIK